MSNFDKKSFVKPNKDLFKKLKEYESPKQEINNTVIDVVSKLIKNSLIYNTENINKILKEQNHNTNIHYYKIKTEEDLKKIHKLVIKKYEYEIKELAIKYREKLIIYLIKTKQINEPYESKLKEFESKYFSLQYTLNWNKLKEIPYVTNKIYEYLKESKLEKDLNELNAYIKEFIKDIIIKTNKLKNKFLSGKNVLDKVIKEELENLNNVVSFHIRIPNRHLDVLFQSYFSFEYIKEYIENLRGNLSIAKEKDMEGALSIGGHAEELGSLSIAENTFDKYMKKLYE